MNKEITYVRVKFSNDVSKCEMSVNGVVVPTSGIEVRLNSQNIPELIVCMPWHEGIIVDNVDSRLPLFEEFLELKGK